jgi:pimeloyl-ACP methyl ester carboxylesterase
VRNDITAEDPGAALLSAVVSRPLDWMKSAGSSKLLIYAHGGLNSEDASVARIRAIAPYALDNGVYPLFITWRSGAVETASDLVEEMFAKLGLGVRGAEPARGWTDRITEKTDRLMEPLLRGPGGAMWGQMKLNAERASRDSQGGCRLVSELLRELRKQRPSLEIHLIGHSAGAIVLGALLGPLSAAGLKVSSLRLFAPACTTRFALESYRPAIKAGTLEARHWHIHVLSDKNERDDNVGPYRKSLLYLVSRSFEDAHKMPLLGLDKSFDSSTTGQEAVQWAPERVADVKEWIGFWDKLGIDQTNRAVLDKPTVSTGAGSTRAAHGCFDNAVDIMGDALGYVVSSKHPKRVKIHKLDY